MMTNREHGPAIVTTPGVLKVKKDPKAHGTAVVTNVPKKPSEVKPSGAPTYWKSTPVENGNSDTNNPETDFIIEPVFNVPDAHVPVLGANSQEIKSAVGEAITPLSTGITTQTGEIAKQTEAINKQGDAINSQSDAINNQSKALEGLSQGLQVGFSNLEKKIDTSGTQSNAVQSAQSTGATQNTENPMLAGTGTSQGVETTQSQKDSTESTHASTSASTTDASKSTHGDTSVTESDSHNVSKVSGSSSESLANVSSTGDSHTHDAVSGSTDIPSITTSEVSAVVEQLVKEQNPSLMTHREWVSAGLPRLVSAAVTHLSGATQWFQDPALSAIIAPGVSLVRRLFQRSISKGENAPRLLVSINNKKGKGLVSAVHSAFLWPTRFFVNRFMVSKNADVGSVAKLQEKGPDVLKMKSDREIEKMLKISSAADVFSKTLSASVEKDGIEWGTLSEHLKRFKDVGGMKESLYSELLSRHKGDSEYARKTLESVYKGAKGYERKWYGRGVLGEALGSSLIAGYTAYILDAAIGRTSAVWQGLWKEIGIQVGKGTQFIDQFIPGFKAGIGALGDMIHQGWDSTITFLNQSIPGLQSGVGSLGDFLNHAWDNTNTFLQDRIHDAQAWWDSLFNHTPVTAPTTHGAVAPDAAVSNHTNVHLEKPDTAPSVPVHEPKIQVHPPEPPQPPPPPVHHDPPIHIDPPPNGGPVPIDSHGNPLKPIPHGARPPGGIFKTQ